MTLFEPEFFSDMKTFLYISVFAQYQQRFVVGEAGIRCDGEVQFSISFDRHDIDVVFLADVDLADGFSQP